MMEDQLHQVLSRCDAVSDPFVSKLRSLCGVPSVSAHGTSLQEAAEELRAIMVEVGLHAKVVKVPGGPDALYGELGVEGAERTLLIYNHYDVQPPDPLEEWISDPFAADVRDGYIFARGVADNKGAIVSRLGALKAILDAGLLPSANLKYFVEGEEEVGSPNLPKFISKERELLRADGCLWEGGHKTPSGRPEIHAGVKGLLYVELSIETAEKDLHSSFAPLVPNPAWSLIEAIGSLRNKAGRIQIEGFYDDIIAPSAKEMTRMEKNEFDPEMLMKWAGVTSLLGSASSKDRAISLTFEPTCNICGIDSGYKGHGSKTVLPRRATTKIDFRLVPNQDPDDILAKLRKHLQDRGFGKIRIQVHSSEKPAKSDIDSKIVHAILGSAQKVYGQTPNIWPSMPGTGPMTLFVDDLGIPCSMGVGVEHTGSGYHAPNENISIADFTKGMKHAAALMLVF